MSGEPFIYLLPALFVLGNGDIGKLGVFNTEDGDGGLFDGVFLYRSEFHTEYRFDPSLSTGADKLVAAGTVVDICQYKCGETLLVGGGDELFGGEGPVLKGIICVTVEVHFF